MVLGGKGSDFLRGIDLSTSIKDCNLYKSKLVANGYCTYLDTPSYAFKGARGGLVDCVSGGCNVGYLKSFSLYCEKEGYFCSCKLCFVSLLLKLGLSMGRDIFDFALMRWLCLCCFLWGGLM